MSRHRDIRRLDYSEDFGEDIYGKSLEDDYAVSPTSAQFIFNRENSQGASLMSYMSSKEPVPISPLNVSTKSDTPIVNLDVKTVGISNMSDVQLDSGIQYIRNVVGYQFSEEDMVDAMRHCNMDAEAALNQLLERGSKHEKGPKRDSDILSDSKPVRNLFNDHHNVSTDNFDTSHVSLSQLASLHSQQQRSFEGSNAKTNQRSSVSDFSLNDLANMYLHKPPSQDIDVLHGVPSGGDDGEKTFTSTASLSLADLASAHISTAVRTDGETSSTNLSLSELANLHVSSHSMSTSFQQSEDILATLSASSPVLEANPTASAGLDFGAGFATPKTGSMLSLSQLASLGTKSVPPVAVKSHATQTNSGGLAALATAHFSSMVSGHTDSSNPIDLKSVRPPPGFKVLEEPVLKASEDISLSSVVKKLTIQESNVMCVSSANASQFAGILCMPEKRRSKKLDVRHRHLRKKSWKKISNLHIPRFSFATPSPDDFILNRQKLVFTSDPQ